MAGTSSSTPFQTAKVIDEQLKLIRDKDSLEECMANMYTAFAKFRLFGDSGLQQLARCKDKPTETINIGDNRSVSYTFIPTPNADDRKKYVMKLFGDATRDCDDREMKQIFDMTQDYESLEKYLYMFFDSMVHSGVLDKNVLNKKLRLPGAAVLTYVIGVGVTVGNTSAALKAFQHMSASQVAPMSYTYVVLIKGLTADPDYCGDAKKFLLEMMNEGMRPDVATYTAVIEGFAKQEDKAAEEEGKQLVEVMVRKGFAPNAKAMMEVLKGKPKLLTRKVINIALSKLD